MNMQAVSCITPCNNTNTNMGGKGMIILKENLLAHIKRHKRIHGRDAYWELEFYPDGNTVRLLSRWNGSCLKTTCPIEGHDTSTAFAVQFKRLEKAGILLLEGESVEISYFASSDGYGLARFAGNTNTIGLAVRPCADTDDQDLQTQFTAPRGELVSLTEVFQAKPRGIDSGYPDYGAELLIKESRLVARRYLFCAIYEATSAYQILSVKPVQFRATFSQEDAKRIRVFLKDTKVEDIAFAQDENCLFMSAGKEELCIESFEGAQKASISAERILHIGMPNGICINKKYVAQQIEDYIKATKYGYYDALITMHGIKFYGCDGLPKRDEIAEIAGGMEAITKSPVALINARYLLDAIKICGIGQDVLNIDFLNPLEKSFARVRGKNTVGVIAGIYA